ncbi:MAG: hypothetical protein CMJ49_07645 [Planctomycetaceae bacterium]|nr:hypothetical protein [Planctomycetaceae bacterium]
MAALQIPFSLSNPWAFDLYGLPLRCSLPLGQGELGDPAVDLVLLDEQGRDLGGQWRVLSTWPDGSARFALLDYAEAHVPPRTTCRYTVERRAGRSIDGAVKQQITVSEDKESLTVDTGRLRWTLSKRRFSLAESIELGGRAWVAGQQSDLLAIDMNDQIHRASQGEYTVTLEEAGPYRVIVLIKGDYRSPLATFMSYKLRLHFSAGGSQVLVQHTVRNRHDGREGLDVKRLAMTGALDVGAGAVRRIEHAMRGRSCEHVMLDIPENVDLDTGEYTTVIRNGDSLREHNEDICWVVKSGTDIAEYGECSALLDLHEPGVGGVLIKWAMEQPDYQGPLRLASDQNRFEIDFYPESDEPMHLGEGMGKTRDVLLNFHDGTLSAQDQVHETGNLSYPGVTAAPRQMYRDAQFADMHRTLEPQRHKYPLLESKIDLLLMAQKSFDWPYAHGWRDYGDEVGARGRCPEFGVTQYINNEEDYLYVCMIDAWRLGKAYGGLGMARHLMDIDYIDYSPDPSRDGGVCPHSANHTDGEVYPSHQWCQGLLYFYLATGDLEALRIARRIGDNLTWWVTGPRSGSLLASGREAAWPLLSLASLFEVTGETKYRDAGMTIVNTLRDVFNERGQLEFEYPLGSGVFSSYMVLMTFNGIWDMYAATGDETILEFWKALTGPHVEQLSDPEDYGYLHFRNWPIKWADLTTLTRWYELTGDKKYVELGRNGLRLALAAAPQSLMQTQGIIAMGYRHFILFMKLADEFGMIDDDHVTLVW